LLNLLGKALAEPDQAFGQALRSLRTKRKWTQTDLALRADVDRNYVSLIELGRNSPSVRMVFRLCDALDITPSDMLKDVERRIRVQAKGHTVTTTD
jgi:transcriptional regulator with XRE-family HTH domain